MLYIRGIVLAILVNTTCAVVRIRHYDYGVNAPALSRRQTTSYFATTGARTNANIPISISLRREVREMEEDTFTWTLYLLGLDLLQYTNQSEMLSWYQIAGIHGRPYVSFDGSQATAGNQNSGYCQHVSILFPTWHRPYLALYEQVLFNIIQWIAQQYPVETRDEYVAAAANFRIPYWDWAAVPPTGQSVLPLSVGGSAVVKVAGPLGTQEIANPLFAYQFQPLDPFDLPDPPFNQYTSTLRYPTTEDSNAVSQNDLVAEQLDNNRASIQSRLYNLFTNYHNYTTFSNEVYISIPKPNNYDSIESIHDQIHGLTGSGGHMSYIEYSAFDPIFFLHHAMIDRCFAIWQALNPKSYVEPQPSVYSTFTNTAGQIQDVATPLTPFYDDTSGDFWTSNRVRSTQTFGYDYLETVNATSQNGLTQLIASVNSLYGNTNSFQRRDSQSHQHREWIANILVQKHALSAPFFIHIFLGPLGSDPAKWPFESTLVGSHCVFLGMTNSCASCNDQIVTATVPLTQALEANVANGKLASMHHTAVEDFISRNLQYRISLMNNTAVGNGDISSLKITIVSARVHQPETTGQLPVWEGIEEHMSVTTG